MKGIYHSMSFTGDFDRCSALPLLCVLIFGHESGEERHHSANLTTFSGVFFLKTYNTEHVTRAVTGADEKTLRKWVWIFVELISFLRWMNWCDRLQGREHSAYKASVDGVDFNILEPTPFDGKWHSHKFKRPGLRYELGVGVATGNICWLYGPFPCGSHSDLKIFRSGMKKHLSGNELVVADGGYPDERWSYTYLFSGENDWGAVRARHEALNKRLKQFGVLKKSFVTPSLIIRPALSL